MNLIVTQERESRNAISTRKEIALYKKSSVIS